MQKTIKIIVPQLGQSRHKGQNGKIAIIGGSLEYTGAPYYAGISSLKGGGDLAYIYCTKSAAIPIKSYSPELIVYPYLDDENQWDTIIKQCQGMSSLVIGPGLGREEQITKFLNLLFSQNNSLKILDADGLWHISQIQNTLIPQIKEKSNQFILTPNIMEIKRLCQYFNINYVEPIYQKQATLLYEVQPNDNYSKMLLDLSNQLNQTIIIAKGEQDIVTNGQMIYAINQEGALKRCGGQGDILSGLTGLYGQWAIQKEKNPIYGCILASIVTRISAKKAQELGTKYSLTTPKIIDQIGWALDYFLAIL